MTTGILYIVATPIGNLNDITLRAIEVLKQVDVIAAEDTRHSKKLLEHYGIDTRLMAVHDHNENDRIQSLLGVLQGGASVALISDAGTPLISDPGFRVVRAMQQAGIEAVCLDGGRLMLADPLDKITSAADKAGISVCSRASLPEGR